MTSQTMCRTLPKQLAKNRLPVDAAPFSLHWLSGRNVLSTGDSWVPYKWGQIFRSPPWPELVHKGARWLAYRRQSFTHDVGIVDHLLRWCVRSRPAVIILHQFQSFYCRLVWCASKQRYLVFSKLHLSINAANRTDVAIHKSSAYEYYHSEIIKNHKDSLIDSTSKSYA